MGIEQDLGHGKIEIDAGIVQESLHNRGRLGDLKIEIPDTAVINVNLTRLFRHAINLKGYEEQTSPPNIVAICVYGSSLYKHFEETKITEQRRKKWLLFGPDEITRRQETIRKKPRDLDVMVITKTGLTPDKVVIPKRTRIKHRYGFIEQSDGASGVKISVPYYRYGYFERYIFDGHLDLHITYRSIDQFKAGIGHGDTLSESVFAYGLPLLGSERFKELMGDIRGYERKPLHQIKWVQDGSHTFNATIV